MVMAAATAMASGCYTYVPWRPGEQALAPGAEVRVQLNDAGASELTKLFGPRVTSLQGQVVSMRPDSALELGVNTISKASGIDEPYDPGAPVTIPLAYLQEVERRTLSGRRTVVAAGGTVVAAVGIAAAALRTGHQGGGGKEPPPPPP